MNSQLSETKNISGDACATGITFLSPNEGKCVTTVMHVPLILTNFLDRAVNLYGDKLAIIGDKNSYTYAELGERVNQLSNGLKALNIEKGDKVAYLAPNTVEMLEGFYGTFQVGKVMTPLNTRLKSEDYLYILNHIESKVLFVDAELYPLVEPILKDLPNDGLSI
ncbi:AMP-binding protein [Alkalihalobacillus deserti]|uniref:AMP-binding protein n=1 Tax=Alkalihalobacillus deserti TaxID=2879466 RepID=UPI0035584133